MEQNQAKIEEMQEPEGLPMAFAVLQSIEVSTHDAGVYAKLFDIIKANADPEAAAGMDASTEYDFITTQVSLAVSAGTAIAMLRNTPSTVLVNLCGMIISRMQADVLASIGVLLHSPAHREITNTVLAHTRKTQMEHLDNVGAQSIH